MHRNSYFPFIPPDEHGSSVEPAMGLKRRWCKEEIIETIIALYCFEGQLATFFSLCAEADKSNLLFFGQAADSKLDKLLTLYPPLKFHEGIVEPGVQFGWSLTLLGEALWDHLDGLPLNAKAVPSKSGFTILIADGVGRSDDEVVGHEESIRRVPVLVLVLVGQHPDAIGKRRAFLHKIYW